MSQSDTLNVVPYIIVLIERGINGGQPNGGPKEQHQKHWYRQEGAAPS